MVHRSSSLDTINPLVSAQTDVRRAHSRVYGSVDVLVPELCLIHHFRVAARTEGRRGVAKIDDTEEGQIELSFRAFPKSVGPTDWFLHPAASTESIGGANQGIGIARFERGVSCIGYDVEFGFGPGAM